MSRMLTKTMSCTTNLKLPYMWATINPSKFCDLHHAKIFVCNFPETKISFKSWLKIAKIM
jgi:hypothetical protein